jgi:hypothetical protein
MRGLSFLIPWRSELRREARNARRARRAEKRHAHRVMAVTPVLVYGWLKGEPFAESTKTINVSAQGGLIPIASRVVASQKLLLTNLQTEEDLPCRVARVEKTTDGETVAGLEFLEQSPLFWCIEFAPAPLGSQLRET